MNIKEEVIKLAHELEERNSGVYDGIELHSELVEAIVALSVFAQKRYCGENDDKWLQESTEALCMDIADNVGVELRCGFVCPSSVS